MGFVSRYPLTVLFEEAGIASTAEKEEGVARSKQIVYRSSFFGRLPSFLDTPTYLLFPSFQLANFGSVLLFSFLPHSLLEISFYNFWLIPWDLAF